MKRRLSLVGPTEELLGIAPPALERAARGCAAGDATHRGLLFLCATLARRAVTACLPPKARGELSSGLDVVEAWARDTQPSSAVRTLRAQCFGAAPVIERQTVEVVQAATAQLPPQRKTGLDAHASRVVQRYVALSAHYTVSAVVLCLDAVEQPARCAEIPNQVTGARAYQAAGLGAARFGEFRAKAWEQAEWESAREGTTADHSVEALALQIFHEFLGARWKSHADLELLAQRDFIDWALAPFPPAPGA